MGKRVKKKFCISDTLLRIVVFAVTIILLLILWQNRKFLYQFESLGYIGLFVINAVSNATVFLPLPSIAAVFIGGSVWNPLIVGFVTGLGNAVGELVGFFLGFGSRGILDKLDGKRLKLLKKVEKWFKKSGFITVFVMSAMPLPVFDVIGVLAGTLNYPIWKFFIATALGRIMRNFIIAWSGAKIIS